MKFKQLIILWIGILIIVANCLYVPFVYSENNLAKGYYPIWEPPVEEKDDLNALLKEIRDGKKSYIKFSVDFPRLSLQIGVAAVVLLGLLFTFSSRKNTSPTSEDANKPTDPVQATEPIKKRSILDNPKQRRFFEQMGTIYKVDKPDTEDKKDDSK